MTKFIGIALLVSFLSACSSTPDGQNKMSKQDRSDALIEVGAAYLNEGNPTAALIQLKEAEELNSKNPVIHYLLALTYFQKHESKLAIRAAQKAIEINPKFSAAKNTLGKLYLDSGNFILAEKYLKEAAADLTFPDAYLAKTNLGILYFKKTNHAEAERWLSRAILDAGNGACMAAYYRGQLYFQNNQFEKAKEDFARASRTVCAQFTDAHMATAKTFLRMKKYDQARAKFVEIQQLFPSSDAAVKANEFLKEIP